MPGRLRRDLRGDLALMAPVTIHDEDVVLAERRVLADVLVARERDATTVGRPGGIARRELRRESPRVRAVEPRRADREPEVVRLLAAVCDHVSARGLCIVPSDEIPGHGERR